LADWGDWGGLMRKFDDFEGRSPYPRESGEIVPSWYRWYLRAVGPSAGLFVLIAYMVTWTLPNVLFFGPKSLILVGSALILLLLLLAHIAIVIYAYGQRFTGGFLPFLGHFFMLCWIFLCFAALLPVFFFSPN
jgi:hypothetical protein